MQHHIDSRNFSRSELLNFLVAAHHDGYGVNTLKLFKTAALKFHRSPANFIMTLTSSTCCIPFARKTPPQPLFRRAVDLQPNLQHVSSLAHQASTDLHAANQVAAFLLGLVAFLRPSNLHLKYFE